MRESQRCVARRNALEHGCDAALSRNRDRECRGRESLVQPSRAAHKSLGMSKSSEEFSQCNTEPISTVRCRCDVLSSWIEQGSVEGPGMGCWS